MVKATNITLAENVEKVLLNYFHSQNLKPGDMLPRETELAERMHMSRAMVREGVSRLKAVGLIDARKKRGSVLCYPEPFVSFQKFAEAGIFTQQDRRCFMELRVGIELGLCDFIFARKTGEKIAKLRSLVDHVDKAIPSRDEEFDFHSCLVSFAENSAANNFRSVIMMAFGSFRIPTTVTERTTPSHQDICDELESGSSESFRAVMRAHFTPYLTIPNVV